MTFSFLKNRLNVAFNRIFGYLNTFIFKVTPVTSRRVTWQLQLHSLKSSNKYSLNKEEFEKVILQSNHCEENLWSDLKKGQFLEVI